jgi:hypothetical protein
VEPLGLSHLDSHRARCRWLERGDVRLAVLAVKAPDGRRTTGLPCAGQHSARGTVSQPPFPEDARGSAERPAAEFGAEIAEVGPGAAAGVPAAPARAVHPWSGAPRRTISNGPARLSPIGTCAGCQLTEDAM